jgi:hypothetical protein
VWLFYLLGIAGLNVKLRGSCVAVSWQLQGCLAVHSLSICRQGGICYRSVFILCETVLLEHSVSSASDLTAKKVCNGWHREVSEKVQFFQVCEWTSISQHHLYSPSHHLPVPSLFPATHPLPSNVHTQAPFYNMPSWFWLLTGCTARVALSSTKIPSLEALFDTEFMNVSGMYKRVWAFKSTVWICEDRVQ